MQNMHLILLAFVLYASSCDYVHLATQYCNNNNNKYK